MPPQDKVEFMKGLVGDTVRDIMQSPSDIIPVSKRNGSLLRIGVCTWKPAMLDGNVAIDTISLLLLQLTDTPNHVSLLFAMTYPVCISSNAVAHDYIWQFKNSGGRYWFSVFPDSVKEYRKGQSVGDTYTEPTEPKALNLGDMKVCESANLFSELADTGKCAVVLFDSQHYMYKKKKNYQTLLEIQFILKHVGFSFVKSVNGGEIVIYFKGK